MQSMTTTERTVVLVVYIIIALLALTMNIFIIAVIFKNKLHRRVSCATINLAMDGFITVLHG